MSKPLIANKDRTAEARKYHDAVFAMFGGKKRICALCGGQGATDAAHVIGRAHLGPLRYADPRMARPAHRWCHEAQTRHDIEFSLEIRQDAVRAHNLVARVKMPEPII